MFCLHVMLYSFTQRFYFTFIFLWTMSFLHKIWHTNRIFSQIFLIMEPGSQPSLLFSRDRLPSRIRRVCYLSIRYLLPSDELKKVKISNTTNNSDNIAAQVRIFSNRDFLINKRNHFYPINTCSRIVLTLTRLVKMIVKKIKPGCIYLFIAWF